MPIYEYRCQKCGEFETMQRITEAPLKKCPTCGSKVTKLISNTSFQLKGSGWYLTDYARSGSKEGRTESSSESSAKKDSSESKPGKPEKKSSGKEKAAA